MKQCAQESVGGWHDETYKQAINAGAGERRVRNVAFGMECYRLCSKRDYPWQDICLKRPGSDRGNS
jgi:hypothetical protein